MSAAEDPFTDSGSSPPPELRNFDTPVPGNGDAVVAEAEAVIAPVAPFTPLKAYSDEAKREIAKKNGQLNRTVGAERILFGLLTEVSSIEKLKAEFDSIFIPSVELRAIYEWAIHQYELCDGESAPTPLMFEESVADDHGGKSYADILREFEIDIHEVPDESVEWVMEEMRARYLTNQSNKLVMELATEVTMAPSADRPRIFAEIVAKLDKVRDDLYVDDGMSRAVTGDAVLRVPAEPDSMWGQGQRCLWAAGEPLIICGPIGVGKTTLAQQLVCYMTGIRSGAFLGFPVASDRRVLYIAGDRPGQAMRSLQRMTTEENEELLHDGLVIWKGPLPFDITKDSTGLVTLADKLKCDTIFLDSLKDVASDITKDEGGTGINRAVQNVVAEGYEVCTLHHQKKMQSGNKKPTRLDDLYGSTFIPAGAGSVVLLWGEPGDDEVELTHLKQPAEIVGPLRLTHDKPAGITTVSQVLDAYSIVQGQPNGTTAAFVAVQVYGSNERKTIEKARRQLDKLTDGGRIWKQDGSPGAGADGGPQPTMWFPLTSRHED